MSSLIVGEKGFSKSADGFIYLDGILLFRIIERDGQLFLQAKDYDRARIKCRRTYFVEIPLEIFIAKITPKIIDKPESEIQSEKPA